MLIDAPDKLSLESLTEILRTDGALERGSVTSIEVDTNGLPRGLVSDVARLRVTYSPDAQGQLPALLFLKTSRPGSHPEIAAYERREVEFFRLAKVAASLPAPHCYAAGFDEGSSSGFVLLDDLSDTHFQRPLPLPPSNRGCELIVETLADLHARFWASPRLGVDIGERLTEAMVTPSVQRLHDTVPGFFDYLGDALLPDQRAAYERILASSFIADGYKRLVDLDRLTLVHGDAHTGNLMLPRDEADGSVMLVDWQLWHIGVAAEDLAFLMALHWPSSRRDILERPLLELYHRRLTRNGADYSWPALWDDYRRAVITCFLIPIGQFRRGLPAGVVWFGLQDAFAAYSDLNCEELLN